MITAFAAKSSETSVSLQKSSLGKSGELRIDGPLGARCILEWYVPEVTKSTGMVSGLQNMDYPLLIISLDGNTRNPGLRAQAEAFGWNPMLWRASDFRRYTADELSEFLDKEVCQRTGYYPLAGGEIGCAHSHLSIYSSLRNSEWDWVIILEDDAVLESHFGYLRQVLDALTSRTPRILSLGPPLGIPTRPWTRLAHYAGTDEIELVRYFTPPTRTLGYAINQSALRWAAQFDRVTGLADWPPWAFKVEFWGVSDRFVTQAAGSGVSTIAGREAFISSRRKHLGRISVGAQAVKPGAARSYSQVLGGYRAYARYVLIPYALKLLFGRSGTSRG